MKEVDISFKDDDCIIKLSQIKIKNLASWEGKSGKNFFSNSGAD